MDQDILAATDYKKIVEHKEEPEQKSSKFDKLTIIIIAIIVIIILIIIVGVIYYFSKSKKDEDDDKNIIKKDTIKPTPISLPLKKNNDENVQKLINDAIQIQLKEMSKDIYNVLAEQINGAFDKKMEEYDSKINESTHKSSLNEEIETKDENDN
jgi:flagellar basal body-associated protein FliL